jgi:hypothetical protein
MIDFGTITFSQYYADNEHSVTHTLRGDASLDEVVEAFEYFLKGAGYHLPEGCHIGYEYDEVEDPEIHPIGDLSDTDEYSSQQHSEYYYDHDRNMAVAGSSITVDTVDSSETITINVADLGEPWKK